MTFIALAFIPQEVQLSSLRLEKFDEKRNSGGLGLCIDTIDEVHDIALSQIVSQKQAKQEDTMLR